MSERKKPTSLLERYSAAIDSEESWRNLGQNFIHVADSENGVQIGEIIKREKKSSNNFIVGTAKEELILSPSELHLMNSPSINLGDDLVNLEHSSLFAIYHSIKTRFENRQVYTWMGQSLVFMNPFKRDHGMYTEGKMKKYGSSRKDQSNCRPHIFSLADTLYLELGRNPSISQLIAFNGKSENLEQFVRYLQFVTGDVIGNLILDAILVLNAFGSLTKIVEIDFYADHIAGAVVDGIVGKVNGVVFETLLSNELRDKYQLPKSEPNDSELESVINAMKSLGLKHESILMELALIYHIRDIKNDTSKTELIQKVFNVVITDTSVESIEKEVQQRFDALFELIVKEINTKLAYKGNVRNYMVLLDIPDQVVVDSENNEAFSRHIAEWCNTALLMQQCKKEQDLYVLEKIDWKQVEFVMPTVIELPELSDSCLKSLTGFKDRVSLFTSSCKIYQMICLSPNTVGKPGIIQPNVILQQIQDLNILPLITISRKGYSDHYHAQDFYIRYRCLCMNEILDEVDEVSEQCREILKCSLKEQKFYRIGRSQILLKNGTIFQLEDLRAARIIELIGILQARARGTLVRARNASSIPPKDSRPSLNNVDSESLVKLQKELNLTKHDKEMADREIVKLKKIIGDLQVSKPVVVEKVTPNIDQSVLVSLKNTVNVLKSEKDAKDGEIVILKKTISDLEVKKQPVIETKPVEIVKQQETPSNELDSIKKTVDTLTFEKEILIQEAIHLKGRIEHLSLTKDQISPRSWMKVFIYPVVFLTCAVLGYVFFDQIKAKFK